MLSGYADSPQAFLWFFLVNFRINSFVADVDPALVQEICDVSQGQRKSDIHHNRQADNLGAAVKALECVCFHHKDRLRKRPARFNANPSDKTRIWNLP